MITLTLIQVGHGYDDEITINPEIIRTMRIVSIGDDPDTAIICTEIDMGIVKSDDEGTISSQPIYVTEEPMEIVAMIREWARGVCSS